MKTNFSHEDSATDPLATFDGAAPKREDPFLKDVAAMCRFRLGKYLESIVADMPQLLLGDPEVKNELTRTGNSAFRFDSIRVKPVEIIWEATEIQVKFEYAAQGHLGGDHHEKRTLDGGVEAIFLPQKRISFVDCFAKVKPHGAGAVNSESPQPK